MNVLLLTPNGREHALAVAYSKSPQVKKVIMIPGNGLTEQSSKKIKNYSSIDVWNFQKILEVCKKEQIDFVDVSQDDIIGAGYVDKFLKAGFKAFGPTQKAAQIEWDKAWARDFMKKYSLPIPEYEIFSNDKKAIQYVNACFHRNDKEVLFIKAAGLAGGKGVVRATNKEQALEAINEMKQFKKSGETFVIEHQLLGEEFSLFALCDGEHYKIIGCAQDHKTVYNNNTGPNTGGMGCVSNPQIITPKIQNEIEEKILKPFMKNMQQEGRPYVGVLYLGGMLTPKGPKIIEFNARWGDPEAEVLIPSIQNDYIEIVTAVINKKLEKLTIRLDKKKRVSIATCSFGYPKDYSSVNEKEIFGIDAVLKIKGVTLYGAGIKRIKKRFFAHGGRLFHVVAEGKDIIMARRLAYESLSMLYIEGNNMHYRTDIGWAELERKYL